MVKSNLVIQTAFLGDLILSIPVLNRIKTTFPNHRLVVVCKKGLGDFLIREKIVDQVIEVEKSNAQSYRAARNEAGQLKIHNLYCLHKSLRSLLFSARLKADRKYAFSSFAGKFVFDQMMEFEKGNPEVLRQFKILEPTDSEVQRQLSGEDFTGLNKVNADGSLPAVPDFFSFKEKSKSSNGLKKIAVFPGSVWATKRWTQEGFTALCKLLVAQNYQVDLLGGPDEKALCDLIAADCGGPVAVRAGQFSIADSLIAVGGYDLVICNDSAATHMAAYNGTKVITVFGPTVPAQGFRPWSNNSYIIENSEMSCRPCGRHGHNECPLGHHNCMKSVEALRVFNLAQKILS